MRNKCLLVSLKQMLRWFPSPSCHYMLLMYPSRCKLSSTASSSCICVKNDCHRVKTQLQLNKYYYYYYYRCTQSNMTSHHMTQPANILSPSSNVIRLYLSFCRHSSGCWVITTDFPAQDVSLHPPLVFSLVTSEFTKQSLCSATGLYNMCVCMCICIYRVSQEERT